MRARGFASLFYMVLVLGSTGCTTVSVVPLTGPTPPDPASSATHLVTTKSGPAWRLVRLQIRNDSLVGNRIDGGFPREVAFPVGEIRTVEVRKVNAGGTLGILGGVAIALAVIASSIRNMSFGP